jgi:protein-disulfide isomerase
VAVRLPVWVGMAARSSEKQRLRAQREARERAAVERARRKRRGGLLAGVLAAAAVLVALAIAVSGGGGDDSPGAGTGAGAPVGGAAETRDLFAGITQRGTDLGRQDAPVTLVEYADLRCPACRAYTLDAFPALVRRYVRAGNLRIVFRPQTFVGEQFAPGDSERAARFALAAGQQDRLWPFVDLFYRNQGDETTTYVTDSFLRRLGNAVPGLDVSGALAAMDSRAVDRQLALADSSFQAAGFSGTPSFELGRTSGPLRPLAPRTLSPSEFTGPIDALLGGR